MEPFIHKKSLGQNFLNSPEIIEKIVEKAKLNNEEIVIEIGAGEGILTEMLVKKAKKVIAIELDDRLIPFLQKKFETTKNIEIIHADILKINMLDFLEKYNLNKENFKVVANIPYYITAPIIRLFLELPKQPKEILLMVQKEVAERIIAKPGEMSILAIACQFYADVEYLFSVSKKFFNPVPKVDSAIIKFTIKNQKDEKDKNFFRLVKIGFSAKRKTLCNNLANGFHKSKDEIGEILNKVDLEKTVRAQELSIEDWKNLEKKLV